MPGLLAASALLLLIAGASKVVRPAGATGALAAAGVPGRWAGRPAAVLLGLVQLLAAAAVLVGAGRLPGVVVAVVFGALTAFSWRLNRVAPDQGCGCFGVGEDPPVGTGHLVVNGALALVGVVAALLPPAALATTLAEQPLAGVPLVALSVALASTCYLAMTALPVTASPMPPRKVSR